MQGGVRVYAEQRMRVCRAADNRFDGCKITKKFVHEQAFAHRKYLIVEAFRGIYLCIVMKMSNAKNLRREVKRQLKELRGRVGQSAVGKWKKANEKWKINCTDFDESVESGMGTKTKREAPLQQVCLPEETVDCRPLTVDYNPEEINFNSQLSILNFQFSRFVPMSEN